MDTEVIKIVGQIAGIGGLSLGVILILFKELLNKLKIPGLKQDQWYTIVLVFMVLVWSIAIFGIGAWVYASSGSFRNNTSIVENDQNNLIHAPPDNNTLPNEVWLTELSWVFSGIGVAALVWLGFLIYRKKGKPKQVQIAGNNSIQIMSGRDSKLE